MTALAEKIRRGDEQAFSQFFHETHYQVVRYLYKLLDHDGYAQDIAQDVYIKVWQNRAQIDPQQSLKAWLFTIVRNCAITHINKVLAEKKRIAVFNVNSPASSFISNEGENYLTSRDALSLFTEATRLVPPHFVRCFILNRQQGLTYQQIADREGISVKTVEKRISITLRHLRTASSLDENMILVLFISGAIQFISAS